MVEGGFHSHGFLGKEDSKDGVRAESTVFGTGYIVEVAIPWLTLHVTPEPELRLGLEVHVNDDDASSGPDRDGKVAWFGTPAMGGVAWVRPDAFATVRLGND